MRLIIMGPQLAGKGTQAGYIAKEYGLMHITTGGILRDMYANGTSDMKAKLEPIVHGGKLLSDEEMNPIVAEYLDKHPDRFILDGFPRTVPQVRFLDTYLKSRNSSIDAVIFLDVPHKELMNRLKTRIHEENRKDDENPDALKKRMKQYETMTLPAIELYRKEGILMDINGIQIREAVFAEIKRELAKKKLPH